MQLATYISDLLYRYECVIIPGFGAFLTQYQSARIDSQTQTFYPPSKTISFNRQLQTNDGLLANYISSNEECAYEVALQKIRNYTAKLSHKLSDGETVLLKNVGEFHLNNEKTIQFEPLEKENFNTASFGLSTFIAAYINREVLVESDDKPVVVLSGSKPKLRPYFKYAAVALIAMSVTGLGSLKLYEDQVQKHNFVEKQKANSLLESQIQEATFTIKNPLPAVNLTIPKISGKYHVIAGAFRIEENANKKFRQLTDQGFNPRLLGKNKYGLHQVAYSSFDDRIEALQNLRSIRNSENSDAWLLVKDLSN